MIHMNNVDKSFSGSSKALASLCIHVGRGSIYGLVGTNGAGKTTALRCIMGILKPDAGEITVGGEPVFDNAKAKQQIGYVSDDPFAFRGYSLLEMASYTAGLYPTWNGNRFSQLTEEYGLDPKAKLSSFSKGMRKQAAFTLALSIMPEVLVLDEPIDGLDPLVRRKTWKYIIDDVADRSGFLPQPAGDGGLLRSYRNHRSGPYGHRAGSGGSEVRRPQGPGLLPRSGRRHFRKGRSAPAHLTP